MAGVKNKLEIVYVDINILKPNKDNPRIHSDESVDKLAKSMEEFNWTNPILVTKDNVVVAGHGRLMAAKKEGFEKVPVIYLPFDAKEAKAYMITDNRTQQESEWDIVKLQALIGDIKKDNNYDLGNTGFDKAELDNMLVGLEDIVTGVSTLDENGDRPKKTIKPKIIKCPCCKQTFEL